MLLITIHGGKWVIIGGGSESISYAVGWDCLGPDLHSCGNGGEGLEFYAGICSASVHVAWGVSK